MKFYMALKHYVRLQGSGLQSSSSRERTIRVPYKFVIPDGHENGWPEDMWGYPLGAKCMAVRQKNLYIKNDQIRKSRLEDIGWVILVSSIALNLVYLKYSCSKHLS